MMIFSHVYSEAFLIGHKESSGINCVITRAGNPCAKDRITCSTPVERKELGGGVGMVEGN